MRTDHISRTRSTIWSLSTGIVIHLLLLSNCVNVSRGSITSRKHIPGAPPFSPELGGVQVTHSYNQNPQTQQNPALNALPQYRIVPKKQPVNDDIVDEQARKEISRQQSNAMLVRAKYSFHQMPGWPIGKDKFGQISAVATHPVTGKVVIFHRGSHKWDASTFDMDNNFLQKSEGPILIDTILTIDPSLGEIVQHWGANFFYLPHGLSFDQQGNIWLTDVAMHQCFKFTATQIESLQRASSSSSKTVLQPSLTLGVAFEQGSDEQHFCKPTSVAIDSVTQDIYVADGYCNARVIRFDQSGKYLSQFGHGDQPFLSSFAGSRSDVSALSIPHKIVLLEEQRLACVADREHGRVMCFNYPDGTPSNLELIDDRFDGRLFSVTYSPAERVLYAVAGNHLNPFDTKPILAFSFNATSRELISEIAPQSGTFAQPHDIAVSKDGNCVYVVEIGPNNLYRLCRAGYTDPAAGSISSSPKSNLLSQPVAKMVPTQPQQQTQESSPLNSMVQSIVTAFPHSLDALGGASSTAGSNSRTLIIALTSVPLVAFLILLFVLQCSPTAFIRALCGCCFNRSSKNNRYRVSNSGTASRRRGNTSKSLLNGGAAAGSPIKGWLKQAKHEISHRVRSDPSRDGFRPLPGDEGQFVADYDVEMDELETSNDLYQYTYNSSSSMSKPSLQSSFSKPASSSRAKQQQQHRKVSHSRIGDKAPIRGPGSDHDQEDEDDESDVEQFNASQVLHQSRSTRTQRL